MSKWYIYLPQYKEKIEPDHITMDFRVNAVSSANITFSEHLILSTWSWLKDHFSIGDPIQVKYGKQIIFNGYVNQVSWSKTQTSYRLQVNALDPLGKLVNMPFRGGFTGRLKDLLNNEICKPININNRILSDLIVNLRYDQEVSRFALLIDACTYARVFTDLTRFGFYYNHQLNALCELNDKSLRKIVQSTSHTNRLSINLTESYIVANVIQVTNY